MAKVKFFPIDKEFEISSQDSVLDVAKDNGIHIKSVCGGLPSCAECRIQIKEGEYNVLAPSPEEVALIGTAHFVDRSRLSCQLHCFGDITIDLTEQIEKAKRGVNTKKARGAKTKTEETESHAVEGSIILGGADLEMFKKTVADGGADAMVLDERLEDQEVAMAELKRIQQKKGRK